MLENQYYKLELESSLQKASPVILARKRRFRRRNTRLHVFPRTRWISSPGNVRSQLRSRRAPLLERYAIQLAKFGVPVRSWSRPRDVFTGLCRHDTSPGAWIQVEPERTQRRKTSGYQVDARFDESPFHKGTAVPVIQSMPVSDFPFWAMARSHVGSVNTSFLKKNAIRTIAETIPLTTCQSSHRIRVVLLLTCSLPQTTL